MRTPYAIATVLALMVVSASAESRQQTGTTAANPLTVESQIHSVDLDGDYVIIHLYRQPFDFVAAKWLRVRTMDGHHIFARDLASRDSIHLEGDLDHDVVYVNRITLQRRDTHLGGE